MKIKPITLTARNKNMLLTPSRTAIYKQSKVIECVNEQQQCFYLIFYKQNFLAAVQADHIKISSHIHHAFTKGFCFDNAHPITTTLLSQQNSYSFNGLNQQLQKVQQKYTPLEASVIYTLFDSFLPVDAIKDLLKKTYYHYRREGQLYAAFQLLNIYHRFDKEDIFAKDMLNNIQFQHYHSMYQELNNLISKDPLHVELECFDHLFQAKYTSLLLQFYKDQHRWMDELALRIHLLRNQDNSDHLTEVMNLMQPFTLEERLTTLQDIATKNKDNLELHNCLLNHLIKSENHNKMVDLIFTTNFYPDDSQLKHISKSIQKADDSVFANLFHQLNTRLIKLFKHDLKALETIVYPIVSSLLSNYSLDEMKQWFTPFHDASIHLPVEQKISKMIVLADDPDQQLELGEFYLSFNQLEKSIDCFKWEMELNPQNPKPVQLLINVYKKLGNQEEASAYQQLFIHMQKNII